MKKALKIVLSIVISVYLILIVFTTAFLLNRNDYGVSSFAGRYLVLVEDEGIEDYSNNTLLFISKVDNKNIEIGQKAFFYDTYSTDHKIKYAEVVRKEEINEKETTYVLKDIFLLRKRMVLRPLYVFSLFIIFNFFIDCVYFVYESQE